jgi:transcriptional antiterminator NusG
MEKIMSDLNSVVVNEVVPGASLTPAAGMQWYVVHAYSGMEKAVERNITERINRAGMQSKFGRFLVPTEEVVEIKNGQKKTTERRFFPGYVLVEMTMDDESWHLVKHTNKPRHKVEFETGEYIRVKDGPFTDFNGTVEEVNYDKNKVRVSVTIFGRATPVELEFSQIEKT